MAPVVLPAPTPEVLGRRNKILGGLNRIVGAEAVISDDAGRRVFDADAWTTMRRMPLAVVLPANTAEAALVLAYCEDEGVKVMARGAGTGLCGAASPTEDAIVLCLARLNKVIDIDVENRIARVEAGVTHSGLDLALAGTGLRFAPEPWSRSVSTLAGNIATNAGGANALKHGTTTNHLLGVTLVLMNGTAVQIGGGIMEAPGYDLLALISGSEGQLGVVTEASFRLVGRPAARRAMLLGFSSYAAAVTSANAILASPARPTALELMDKSAIHLCDKFSKAGYPLDVSALLIVEFEGEDQEIAGEQAQTEALAAPHDPRIVTRAGSDTESDAIWAGWSSAYGAMNQRGGYFCLDGTVPLSDVEGVLERIDGVVRDRGLRTASIYRAGDGTLRCFLLFDADDPAQVERAHACRGAILEVCVRAGGAISGEIGVGIEKRDLMTMQFSAFDLAQQMRIKTVFDPQWLLNPGKMFPLRRSQGNGSVDQS